MADAAEEAWEKYQEVMLLRYPQKALSKREFIAGYNIAAADEAEYENAIAFAEGSAENMHHELTRAEKVNEHLLARNAVLASKLEAIRKLAAEEKYKVSGDRDSYSQYWEGYEFMQDLVEQIIGSPEEDA